MGPRFVALLRALQRESVEFVVVGGVAAVLEGAPIATFDLDIVYHLEPENLERLAAALRGLEARYRDPAGREFHPTVARLESQRVNLLETREGLLDAMQEIGAGWGYRDVVQRSNERTVDGLPVRILDLAAVIASKVAANRDKDRAMLPILRRTLEEQQSESTE